MIVTIFTDASFDPNTGASGWSAWVKFGAPAPQTLRLSGPFREPLCSSGGAELAAIANALHIAARRLPLTKDEVVVLQTDCASAIDIVTGNRRKPLPPFLAACAASIQTTVADFGFRLTIRHVRAHRGTRDKRSAVNTWCDKAARTQMRRKRAHLEGARTPR